VTIDKDNTTPVEGVGKKEEIEKRINELKIHFDKTTSDYDKEKLQERLAKVSRGVAVLKVRAATEVEMKEKKARVEDALHATRAAVEEGIVPRGGVAYLRVQHTLDQVKTDHEDQKIGMEIIRKSLEEPIRMIVQNAGLEGSVIVNKVKEGKDDFGFNAQSEKYENLMQAGVIDPTKVTRIALENAASVAALLLTTEATIVEKPENEKAPLPGMPPHGSMGDMY